MQSFIVMASQLWPVIVLNLLLPRYSPMVVAEWCWQQKPLFGELGCHENRNVDMK
jgi:hypothetical protein